MHRSVEVLNVGSVTSEVLGKRQRPECGEISNGGLRSAALPDDLRLNKLIGEAVQNGLKMIPVRKPASYPCLYCSGHTC